MTERKVMRSAIYTRKSSDEGLEQDFNSLDAQREACAAYIASQKHEGWIERPERYDDGGYSGGTMQRPGLVRLLEDVRAKRVDVIVVYKVDRLTRSLADFAKIVDVLDAQGISFVAVTQQFNTTTSMGRLTLNVLLSFAQFEREIAGERIRDKIRASRQKGMWMGGSLPIGYDVKDRALVIEKAGAALVRRVFERYLELKSVYVLADELRRDNIRTPQRTSVSGHVSGNQLFSRGNLYWLLTNRVYIGLAVHKGHAYPGLHAPILEKELWDRVQAALAESRAQSKDRIRASHPSLLAGLLYENLGERLTPTHATRNGRRLHYYVSLSLITREHRDGSQPSRRWRLPASEVDTVVLGALRAMLKDQSKLVPALALAHLSPAQVETKLASAHLLAQHLDQPNTHERRKLILSLLSRIEIADASVTLKLSTPGLRQALALSDTSKTEGKIHEVVLPVRFSKRHVEQKIILAAEGERPTNRDDVLLKAVARAQTWFEDLKHQRFRDLAEIALHEKLPKTYVHALMPLAFLAPSIVTAILSGRQPADLTLKQLMLRTDLALDWTTQRRQLGFDF